MLLQVKQMAPLAHAASRASQTLVSSVSASLLRANVHAWAGWRRSTLSACIQQEGVEQPAGTDRRPPSELASLGDTPVLCSGDLRQRFAIIGNLSS